MMIKKFLFLALLVFNLQLATAGEFKTGNPERKRSSSEAMTEMVYKKFVKLQELFADGKYSEARAGFNKLNAKKLNGFEKANISQFLGYIDATEEKYVAAAKKFQIAIDSDSLPNQAHFGMMRQIANMLMAGGEHQLGIDALNRYYKVTDVIKDETYANEANAYAQLSQYKKAIPPLKKAISLSEKPREKWLYLLYSMHMQLSQVLQASKILETLIAINPNKEDYWKRLSQVYFSLKKDNKSLATLVLADKNGMLKEESERINLYKMFALLGVPNKAAEVLGEGLHSGVISPDYKHWKSLGELWYSAREMDKALKAFDVAGQKASDGKIDYRRGFIYFDREEFANCKTALNQAIEKGGLTDKKIGKSYLIIGMAESELGNTNAALVALRKSSKYDSTKKYAVQFMDHLNQIIKQKKAKAEQEKMLADAADKIEDTE